MEKKEIEGKGKEGQGWEKEDRKGRRGGSKEIDKKRVSWRGIEGEGR